MPQIAVPPTLQVFDVCTFRQKATGQVFDAPVAEMDAVTPFVYGLSAVTSPFHEAGAASPSISSTTAASRRTREPSSRFVEFSPVWFMVPFIRICSVLGSANRQPEVSSGSKVFLASRRNTRSRCVGEISAAPIILPSIAHEVG